MPQDILEGIAWPDVVRVEEYVEALAAQEIMQLQRGCPCFRASIAYEHPPLTPEQSDTLEHGRCEHVQSGVTVIEADAVRGLQELGDVADEVTVACNDGYYRLTCSHDPPGVHLVVVFCAPPK
ncbi:hypothetical protein ACFSX5_15500 [Devosia albogilva]|uniref:Uncharacterized protein n=1 Tax=Devosia albogilva TaxID=429726 RepID=A0ABW5QPG4_9HYPH